MMHRLRQALDHFRKHTVPLAFGIPVLCLVCVIAVMSAGSGNTTITLVTVAFVAVALAIRLMVDTAHAKRKCREHRIELESTRSELAALSETAAKNQVEHQHFEAVLEASHDAIVNLTVDGIVTGWSVGAEHIYGYARGELLGVNYCLLFPNLHRQRSVELLAAVRNGDRIVDHETRHIRHDGSGVDVSLSILPVIDDAQNVIGMTAIARDITDRIQAECRLADNEERQRAILEAATDAIITIDEGGLIRSFNEAAEQIFGYDSNSIVGQSVGLLMPSPHSERHQSYLRKYMTTGRKRVIGTQQEFQARHGSGRTFPAEISISEAILNSERLFTGIIRDVSARKQAESAARQSEQRLELAIRGTSDGLWDWNIETNEVWFSPQFYALLGYKDGEFAPSFQAWESRLHPDEYTATMGALQGHLGFDQPYDVQYRLETKLGDYKWFRARGGCVRDEVGDAIRMAGSLQDISVHKQQAERLSEQDARLRQKQKLEAVGALAGGVAHEFNNLLQAILGFTRFAQEGLAESDARFQDLSQVLTAAERAASLTSQLLCFSRADSTEARPVNVGSAFEDLAKLLRSVIDERITVKIVSPDGSSCVMADQDELQQALLNMCVNARDAMPDGGELLIRHEDVTLDADYCDLYGVEKAGRYVRFTVSDTGVGMSPEQISRAFEPFYTTKDVGKGTGLGLAMVHGFVERHRGIISIYSEPDEGTTIQFSLPATDVAELPAEDDAFTAIGGTETVLVAEDEPLVQQVVERILTGAGYQVLLANDGEQAVEVFERHHGQIDLALLDVVMPKLTGRQVLEQIRQVDEELPTVFCTGYDPETSQASQFHQDELVLVQKPYDPNQLLSTVRNLLDRKTNETQARVLA